MGRRLPGGDREVVQAQMPRPVEPTSEDCEDKLLEVLRAIRGSKCESSGEPGARSREHRHLRSRLGLVVHLVEPSLRSPTLMYFEPATVDLM